MLARLDGDPACRAGIDAALPPSRVGRREILVTAHRRESFGAPFAAICAALAALGRAPDVEILFPLHPNPALRAAAETALARPAERPPAARRSACPPSSG